MVMGSLRQEAEVAIIGGGPGGYVAALRAADLGKEVILIEQRERPGGVCLLEGCIPSKTLINAVEIAESAHAAKKMGVSFRDVKIDTKILRSWTDKVVSDLSKGIESLLKSRGVEIIHGRAKFSGPSSLEIEGGEISGIDFRDAIIATGSVINEVPAFYKVPVWSSAEALKLEFVPERLLVVGGGYIGLELGLVYAGLGSQVSLVEFDFRILGNVDLDLVKVVLKNCEKRFASVRVSSKVVGIEHKGEKFFAKIESEKADTTVEEYDQVLVAVGRRPNTQNLGLENIGVKLNEQGQIQVSEEGRTSVDRIYAVGDVTPGPMLAHKASREGKIVAEVIAGQRSSFDNRAIPAVVFTDPEIAWTGITEQDAQAQNLKIKVGRFPLSALGRARSIGRTDGFVKMISDVESGLVLGVGIVGPHASELISEGTLAIEMGATLEDVLSTIHPHPTLSEALMEASEVAADSAVHIHVKK